MTKPPQELARLMLERASKGTQGEWYIGYAFPFALKSAAVNYSGGRYEIKEIDNSYVVLIPKTEGHDIYSDNGRCVAGNYDYEEGGIIDLVDANHIATACPANLTRVLEAAEKMAEAMESLMANFACDWYVQQFGSPSNSTAASKLYNAELYERMTIKLNAAREALALWRGEGETK